MWYFPVRAKPLRFVVMQEVEELARKEKEAEEQAERKSLGAQRKTVCRVGFLSGHEEETDGIAAGDDGEEAKRGDWKGKIWVLSAWGWYLIDLYIWAYVGYHLNKNIHEFEFWDTATSFPYLSG